MSAGWALVLAVGATTLLLKGAGTLALGARGLPGRTRSVAALLAPALLAALVVVQTFGAGSAIVLDARAAGVAVAALALAARLPLLAVLALAAATAALLRAVA